MGSVDMSEVEFRRSRRRGPRADNDHHAGLWWQIALGVFTAMIAHSIVTGLYVRLEIYMGLRALGQAIEDVGNELGAGPEVPAPTASRSVAPPRRAPVTMRLLRTDERCVGGKRFRKVENGWVQVLEACR